MAHVIKTNKLNIYLIKEKYRDYDSIVNVDKDDEIIKTDIGDIGVFYYKPSERKDPEWIHSFFNNNGDIDSRVFSISNARAIFIVKITYQRRSRFFAIPFGSGRFFLKNNCFEERFGLITTLNIIESKSIKAIDKRTISNNPKLSREQISSESEVAEFGFNFDTELIQSITGRSTDKNKEFGTTVTGKGVFSIAAKVDLTNIKDFLTKCYETYLKTTYKTKFEWIDKIKAIEDNTLINALNDKLVIEINSKKNNIWISIPEIMDLTEIIGFNFSETSSINAIPELTINDYVSSLNLNHISLTDLLNNNISCWKQDYSILYTRSVYECLNAEINHKGLKYFLIDSKWFLINRNFVSKVNAEFNNITSYPISLPDFDNTVDDEEDYNDKAANDINALCLDREMIYHGGGKNKIEFCDILTKDKEIIHVKRKQVSSMLSHLFSQGHVSCELLLFDQDFRDKLRSKLAHGYKKLIPISKPISNEYKIIFAIITKDINQEIPFFSKITINYHRKVLMGYGYKVFINKIKDTQ